VSEGASLEVAVRALPPGGGKLGVAVLSVPGVPADRYVRIARSGRVAFSRLVWWFDGTQGDRDEIRLDEWQRADVGAGLGDRVAVTVLEPGAVTWLSRLQLTVPPAAAALRADELREFVRARRFPLYRGFRFEYAPAGAGQVVLCRVTACRGPQRAVDFGVCGGDTVVEVAATGTSGTGSSFDDIGGLDREVQVIRETVELPMRMQAVVNRLGVTAPRGLILHGPPGTGKTLLARALAAAVRVPIHAAAPPELRGPDAERVLDRLFDAAEKSERGAVILLDELDAVAGKRDGYPPPRAELVNTLLARMDGLRRAGAFVVIGTTNRLDAIDEALRRHGRFSREIYIGAPGEAGRAQILRIHTRRMPVGLDDDGRERVVLDLARRTHGFVGADLMELCREAGLAALRRVHPLSALDGGDATPQGPLLVHRADFEAALGVIRPSAAREVAVALPDVTFADIAGLDGVIEEIRARVIAPLQHPEVFAAMRLPAERGILLYGPPGTGKTMLAKAIARECGTSFVAVKGPELFSKWVGESEEGVRRVFARARQLAPAVVFFDEIDALLAWRRGSDGDSGVSARVVNQFLAEMDGVVELAGVTVIGATNRRELIDPAALRPGRLGTHIHVPLPDASGRAAVLRLLLPELGDAVDDLAERSEGLSPAELVGIVCDAKRLALLAVGHRHAVPVTAAHVAAALETHRRRAR
jgi:transitional endoplasmic reticulum ATPase